MPHIIVGTAGHIDHGKTALVKALTGIDADRLKEEKERGITIDLGFANLDLDQETSIGFVDVPGHEKFVKNMLAGIGGIDLVMLVVAADESIMPQTREHLDICSLLHIRHGLTVITKIDAADEEIADLVELEVRDYLKSTFLGQSPIVRVSAQRGDGIPELVGTLKTLCAGVEPKDASQIFRLPVDRCFTMKGFGTVVTGTSISGSIHKDEEVELLPSGRQTRIRGIQVHGQAADVVKAGQRTALNLLGVEVGEVHRGVVLTEPDLFEPTSMFDCHLELLESAPGPIRQRKRIRFHVGTAEIMGYVSLLGRERLEPGGQSLVQIRLEEATFALPRDRFIIRQYSPMVTIGGGVILEGNPSRHRRHDERVLRRLETFKEGSLADRLMILVDEAGLGALTLEALVGKVGAVGSTIRSALEALARQGSIRILSERPFTVVSRDVFQRALDQTLSRVQSFHEANPLTVGISREELKTKVYEKSSNLVFQTALQELASREEIAFAQDLIRIFGRKVTLGEHEESIKKKLTDEFLRYGVEVPTPDELIRKARVDPGTARQILQLMLRDGVVVKVNDDLMMHQAAMDGVIERVRSLKGTGAKLGVGEFKDLFGVSRKYAIPLLEYLDRERVTRRVGDSREIL